MPYVFDGQRELIAFLGLTLVIILVTSPNLIINPYGPASDRQDALASQWCSTWNLHCSALVLPTPLIFDCSDVNQIYTSLTLQNSDFREAIAASSAFCGELAARRTLRFMYSGNDIVLPQNIDPATPVEPLGDRCQWPPSTVQYLSVLSGVETVIAASVYFPTARLDMSPRYEFRLGAVFFICESVVQILIYSSLLFAATAVRCITTWFVSYYSGAIMCLIVNTIWLFVILISNWSYDGTSSNLTSRSGDVELSPNSKSNTLARQAARSNDRDADLPPQSS
eukprot:Unigene7843_Nuclearia_a/m.24077 Unigene7843_Nuclearia_a/g.24077  ORF Unigene7843_Nuclearia_a/g.24077 Unigene7843_Nuclearia_a/m.24077 type:complete len:281 (-) Unigene7843_Nuclearia_a:91-933(-)